MLQTHKPVAVSAGLLRSETYVSDGLVRSLSAQHLDVVKAHETAHADRRDGLLRLLGHVFSIGHLPWTLPVLMHELELAQEQACDAVAAKTHGAIRTAETLLAVERLKQALGHETPDACMAFGGADVELRARAAVAAISGAQGERHRLCDECAFVGALTLHHFRADPPRARIPLPFPQTLTAHERFPYFDCNKTTDLESAFYASAFSFFGDACNSTDTFC